MPPNKPYRQINIHGIAAQIFAAYRISENFHFNSVKTRKMYRNFRVYFCV